LVSVLQILVSTIQYRPKKLVHEFCEAPVISNLLVLVASSRKQVTYQSGSYVDEELQRTIVKREEEIQYKYLY
jgi:hypothetical protein